MKLARTLARFAAVLALGAVAMLVQAADPSVGERWPGWRGADGQGIARGVAVTEWTEARNVGWKAEVPGRGHSSPIVWGDRIFLTTAIEGDVVPGAKAIKHIDPDGQEFVHPDATGADHRQTYKVLCLDAGTGRLLWERTAWEGTPADSRHKRASFASPTAVTDGERVYAYFGSEGLYAYDFRGELAWKFAPGIVAGYGVGIGTSPILYKDLVILLCDEDNGEKSYIIGLDRKTGREVWRVPRKVELSWATPVVATAGTRDELVTSGNQFVIAYDPASGKELWRMKGLESNAIATPVVGDGMVVVAAGYPTKVAVAVKLGGSGDLTGTSQVLWRYEKGTAYVPSPILYDGLVYLMTDKGLLTCLDARTGAVQYEGGRPPVAASFMASPVIVDGKILLMSQDGDTFVVKAGRTFEVLRTNPLGEPISASAAVAGGRLYIRGEKHLFAIAAAAGS